MNKIAEKLTGWKFVDAKGKKLEEIFNIIHDETGEKVKNPIDEVLQENKIVALANHTILVSKNGTKYNIADSAAPIRDKESNIIGVILVFRDETENIKMRNEITKMEKIKSISLLAGGIAHDFNNILTGIYGNLELISLTSDKNKIEGYIRNTKQSLDRATDLTKQLLTFSKGGDPIIGTVDIASLTKQVVDFNTLGSNVEVKYFIDDNLWNVKADKGQIAQVISNLVINAKHAMPDGGTLIIEIKNIKDNESDKFVMIRLKDEGKGIGKDLLDKIFEPYFTTKEEGAGLGLSIVLSIINKHNGKINVNSDIGKGTEFTILLPASDETSNLDNISKDLTIDLENKRILVMDDTAEIREVVVNILKSFGCIVTTAVNGEEAIELYKQNNFDVVITDLTVRGGMGGEQTVKEILKIDKNAKVIVSSGYFSGPVMSEYKKYGFVGIIHKPFNIQSLKEELSRVLNI
jgi:PAS domain S-box-containing protein